MKLKIIVVGSGNAALCAGIAALENGAEVTIIEKANEAEMGGNSRYTAGAMRFAYNGINDLMPLLRDPKEERLTITEFGAYPKEKFESDLLGFNDGRPISQHQRILIDQSYDTMRWLSEHHVKFDPIYSRQAFKKDGKFIFWGGLTLEAQGEGVGLIEAELKEFLSLGGTIAYETAGDQLITENGKVIGISCITPTGKIDMFADSAILACGGFEANATLREAYMGKEWGKAKVRGTRHNLGRGLEMALTVGGQLHGKSEGCHAVPMDYHMPNYGNLEIPYIERKNYRKICYFLGVMLNSKGNRFVDEGENFRNYTYAQFGKAILNQPGNFAWQIFDSSVFKLLYSEYSFWDAHFVEAETLDDLVSKLYDIDQDQALKTLQKFNDAIEDSVAFDPTKLDGKTTQGLKLNKTNWAVPFKKGPFKAFPVTCGITFTYAGVKVDENASVVDQNNRPIKGLYACGEMIGGVFYDGYPGGSGLTSGAVFGRIAGVSAATEQNASQN